MLLIRRAKKALIPIFWGIVVVFFTGILAAKAGSLTPSAAPGSTMRSLEEIFNVLAGTYDATSQTASLNGNVSQQLKYIAGLNLQNIYNNSSTAIITTTDGKNITFSLANTTTDADFVVDLLGTGNTFEVRDAGSAVLTVADGGQATFTGNVDIGAGLDVSGAALTFTGTAGSWTFALADSALTQTGTGQVTFAGNLDAANGLDVTGAGLTVAYNPTSDTSKALNVSNSGVVTGTGYAGYFAKTGAATTNVGLYATASGATNNYAAIFESGYVGIGTTTPTAKLQVLGSSDMTQLLVKGTYLQSNPFIDIQDNGGNTLLKTTYTQPIYSRATDETTGLHDFNILYGNIWPTGDVTDEKHTLYIATDTMPDPYTFNTSDERLSSIMTSFSVSMSGTVGAIQDITSFPHMGIGVTGTIGEMTSFYARGKNISGVGGTVNNLISFYSDPVNYAGSVVDNVYGLKLADPNGTYGNKWGVYQLGNSVNYFAGNVGIGTTTPSGKLHVVQTATGVVGTTAYGIYNNFSTSDGVDGTNQNLYGSYNAVTKTGADANADTTTLYAVYGASSNTGSTNMGTKNTYGGYFTATGDTAGTATAVGLYATASGADNNYAAIFNAGYVGIGTTAPATQLELSEANTSASRQSLTLTNTSLGGYGSRIVFRGLQNFGSNLTKEAGVIQVDGQDTWLADATTDSYMSFSTVLNGTLGEKVRIDAAGNVGIGTTVPGRALEINNASGNDLRLTYNDSDGTATYYTDFLVSGAGNLTITPSGGSAGLTGDLSITKSSATDAVKSLNIASTNTATTGNTAYSLYNTLASSAVVTGTAQNLYGSYNSVTKTGADTSTAITTLYGTYGAASNTGATDAGTKNTYGGYFSATGDTAGTATAVGLYATASGADNNYAAIFNAGYVGIGTTTPSETLDVSGTIKADVLNFGTISVLSKTTGKETIYRPAADTDAARGTALANAFTASAAGDTITIGPGDYSITASLAILDYQTIELKSSYIYNTTNTSDIFTANGVMFWSIQGNGRLQGAGMGVGGVYTDQSGVRITGAVGNIWRISGLYLSNFKGAGVVDEALLVGFTGGRISNIKVINSTYGLYVASRAEYLQISQSEFYDNGTGVYVAGGNFLGTNLNIEANGTGVYLDEVTNSGHGQFVGCQINHNTTYSIYANGLTVGMDFIGCHIYSSNASPIYINASKGIQFLGGEMAAGDTGLGINITLDGTFSGYNTIKDVWFQDVEPTISGTALQKSYLILRDNYTGSLNTSTSETARPDMAIAGALTITNSSATDVVKSLSITSTNTATTGNTAYSLYNTLASSAVVTGTAQNLYGSYNSVTKTGADTSTAITTLYGTYGAASNTGATDAGTKNTYGGYFSATGDTAGTATAYGVYATATGADTNYSFFSPSGNSQFQRDSIGWGSAQALSLVNTTAAALGAQQNSPSLYFRGYGWETAVGSSQPVDWQIYSFSIQGTSAPTAQLIFESRANNGSWGTRMYLNESGTLQVNGAVNSGNVQMAYAATLLGVTTDYVYTANDRPMSLIGSQANGASAIGVVLGMDEAYSTAGAKLVSVRNLATEKAYIDKDGGLVLTSDGAATTTDALTITATSLSTGSAIVATGPSGATAGVTDALVKLTSDVGNAGATTPLLGLISSTATIDTSGATTDTGVNFYLSTANTNSGFANTSYGIYNKTTDAVALGNTNYGMFTSVANTGAIDSAITKTIYGSYISASGTLGAPTTAGTTKVYGQYITTTATHAADFGTVEQYGLYIANGTSSTNGTSGKYGLYIDSQTGADSNYALYVAGGQTYIGGTSQFAANVNILYANLTIWNSAQIGYLDFYAGSSQGAMLRPDSTNDQFLLGVDSSFGNQFVFGPYANIAITIRDFDHANQTNPTLFIHSDTDPDTSNNQWGSFSHDQSNFIITTGDNVGAGTGATTNNNGVSFALSTLTAGAAGNYGLSITRTLSDATTAGGETYTHIFANLTETNKTGWPTVNLMDLQVGSSSKFLVADTGATTITYPALGTTTAAGLSLVNTTDAAAGAQQISPSLFLRGEGWETNVGSSMTTDWQMYVLPVQGAAAPTSNLVIQGRINNGAWSDSPLAVTISNLGAITAYRFYGTMFELTSNLDIYAGDELGITGGVLQDVFAAKTHIITGNIADGASAIGVAIGNKTALTTGGAKIVSFINDTTEKAYIDKDGGVQSDTLAGTGNRALYSDANGLITNDSSDARLKKNIMTLSDNIDVINALKQLRGVYYNWDTSIDAAKNLGEQKEIGMIAQEVEAVMPELIGINSTGYRSLNYAKFTAFLLEVDKAQEVRIEEQAGLIQNINNRIDKLAEARAGDLSENYPAQDVALVAGELVALDTKEALVCTEMGKDENGVETCVKTDNERVPFVARVDNADMAGKQLLGVISTQPGVILGGFDEVKYFNYKKVSVALAGRAPVKVNLEGGVIAAGDAITISSEAGVARKATQAGFILGYAVEPFNGATPENEGKVSVFINPGFWFPTEFLASVNNPAASGSGLSFAAVISGLNDMGMAVTDGLVHVKNLIAETVTAKKVATETLEMKDAATGEVYCIRIVNGEWEKVKGECDGTSSAMTNTMPMTNNQDTITNPETPSAENPPIVLPPVEQPPTETPPVETPPAEQPPVVEPPAEAPPPTETPVIENPPTEGLPPAEVPPAE